MVFIYKKVSYQGSVIYRGGRYRITFKDGSIIRLKSAEEFETLKIERKEEILLQCRRSPSYYCTVYENPSRRHCRELSTSKFSNAKILGYEWVMEKCKELGRYRELGIPDWPEILQDTDVREFAAGFCDGDGNLHLGRTGTKISVFQSQTDGIPAILEWFRNVFPNSTYSTLPGKGNVRRKHTLKWSGTAGYFFIKCVAQNGIVKRAQAKILLDFLDHFLTTGFYYDQRQEMREDIQRLNKTESYQEIEIHPGSITNAYIAGLFDAEGSVGSYGMGLCRISISQWSCTRLLEMIRELVGGSIHQGMIRFGSDGCVKLLKTILPFSVQKRSQALIGLRLMETRCPVGYKVPDDVKLQRKELRSELKRLKHM